MCMILLLNLNMTDALFFFFMLTRIKLLFVVLISRRQANRTAARRSRENEKMYITNMEKEAEKLKNDISNTTKRIKLYEVFFTRHPPIVF